MGCRAGFWVKKLRLKAWVGHWVVFLGKTLSSLLLGVQMGTGELLGKPDEILELGVG